MKNNKRLILTILAVALVAAMAVGGTMAYLTDAEQYTNTFTVGDVKVDFIEPNFPGNDTDEVTNITPNDVIAKDPQIENHSETTAGTDQGNAYVFLRVSVPTKNVTLVADDGTKGTRQVQDIFWLKNNDDITDHSDTFNSAWAELTSDQYYTNAAGTTVPSAVDNGYHVRVFAYKPALTAGSTTPALFTNVQLKNVLEDELAQGVARNIKVESFAIQAENIVGSTALNSTARDLTDDIASVTASTTLQNAQLQVYSAIYKIVNNQDTYGDPNWHDGDGSALNDDSTIRDADDPNYGENGGLTAAP